MQIASCLRNEGFEVWIDENEMYGNVDERMAEGVGFCDVFLACISPAFEQSDNCHKEISMASQNKKEIIPVKVIDFKPKGWLGECFVLSELQLLEALRNVSG